MPRESKKAKRERTLRVLERLAELYPDSRCSLDHDGPYQLLVATMLSAQCTDALVNKVTPGLFARFPTPESLAEAELEEIEEAIRQVNFFRNKAKALKGMARRLVEELDSEVPRGLRELVSLPGVGRKTANVVRGVGFGEADGVVVDTHVKRISHRLGLTKQSDPDKVEQDLLPLIPEDSRVVFTHRIIDHGRAVCTARKPKCEDCALVDLCPTSSVVAPKLATTSGA